MNIPYVFKKCTKCGKWLVACKVNFHKTKGCKYNLRSQCKRCKKEYDECNKDHIKSIQKKYRETNKEHRKEYSKQYRERNKEYYNEYRKKYYQDNKEYFKNKGILYRDENKEYYNEYRKKWRDENKEHVKEYGKQHYKEYYERNKEYILEYSKQWRKNNVGYLKLYREKNKEYRKEYQKQYYKTPQGQVTMLNRNSRRRNRENIQGNGITKEQWLECMKFFGFRCAYSGIQLNKDNRTIDHINPISKGGEHEIWNLVPMDKGFNSSKCAKDMLQWYKEQTFFSKERLNKIYEWQEYAYKKWHDKEEII